MAIDNEYTVQSSLFAFHKAVFHSNIKIRKVLKKKIKIINLAIRTTRNHMHAHNESSL